MRAVTVEDLLLAVTWCIYIYIYIYIILKQIINIC